MINLSIEKNEDSTKAVYLLQAGDRIDNLTLGMLVNNRIMGVASVSPVQIKNDRFFQYNITDKISMRDYLGDAVQREKLLRVFLQIAETMLEAGEYMINPTSFLLDEQNIYIDKNTGKLALICIPLLSVVNDGNTCNFFKNVMFSSQFDLEENGDYVGRLITFLNPKTYSLEKFIEEIQGMLGNEKKREEETTEAPDSVESLETEGLTEEEKPAGTQEKTAERKTADIQEESEEEKSADIQEESETEESVKSENEKETERIPFIVRSKTSQKIYITKDEFVIGSEKESVDYCIEDNPAVSRCHARIVKHENEYFVIDNDSRNHTYLNGVLVESGEENFVPHGAMLRFADEDYEFKMHE